jgi:hypothetical protein
MTDHRRNDYNLKYANKQFTHNDTEYFNKDSRDPDPYAKNGHDFLNKGKRHREELEGKIKF